MAAIKRGKRATEVQKEYLINYIQKHPNLDNDKFGSSDDAQLRDRLWKKLSSELNALGGCSKDGPKWRKYWTDLKLYVRAKNAKQTQGINPSERKGLSRLEKLVAELMIPNGSIEDLQLNLGSAEVFKCVVWTKANIVRLIALLKEKTELWNANDPGYPNATKREAAFEAIRSTMNEFMPQIRMKDICAKITILKNQFRNEITRIRTKTGAEKQSRLWCFDHLQFLLPIVEMRYATLWSKANTLRLIKLMQQNKEFWDLRRPGYKDVEKRKAAYKTIRRAMRQFLPKLKISGVRAKITYIRAQFRRQLKRLEKGIEKVPTYWCFNELQFLLPHSKSTTASLGQSNNENNVTSPTPSSHVAAERKRQENDSPRPQKQRLQLDLGADCRVCLKPIEAVPVSLPTNILEFLEHDLKFTYLSIVDLRPDLPQNVCFDCYDNLNSLQRFYAQCRQADDFLKEKLESVEVVDEGSENESLIEEVDASSSASCADLQSSEMWSDDNEEVEFLTVEGLHDDFTATEEELIVESEDYPEECDKSETQADISQTDRDTQELEDSQQFVCDEANSDIEDESGQNENESVGNSQVESDSEDSPDERPFPCKYCDKAFSNNTRRREHEHIHTNTRPHVCDVCGKSFRQATVLRDHLTLHFGKPFQCAECGRRFANKSLLNMHSRIHRNEYRFRCDFKGCTASYIRWAFLRDHKLSHSNLRTVKCELCPSTFNHRNALDRHMRKVHPTMTYRCPQCLWCNAQPYKIRKHLQETHDIEMEDVTDLKIGLPGPQQRQRGINKSRPSTLTE